MLSKSLRNNMLVFSEQILILMGAPYFYHLYDCLDQILNLDKQVNQPTLSVFNSGRANDNKTAIRTKPVDHQRQPSSPCVW